MGRLIVMVVALLGLATVMHLTRTDFTPARQRGRIATDTNPARTQDVEALSSEQRAKILDYFTSHPPSLIDPSHTTITVGSSVPAHIALMPMPPEFANIIGRYRADAYIKVDNRLVVIDPATRRIVAILAI